MQLGKNPLFRSICQNTHAGSSQELGGVALQRCCLTAARALLLMDPNLEPCYISIYSASLQTQLYDSMAVDVGESNRDHTIVAACIVLPITTLIFISLRIWSRVLLTHSVGWDDCR